MCRAGATFDELSYAAKDAFKWPGLAAGADCHERLDPETLSTNAEARSCGPGRAQVQVSQAAGGTIQAGTQHLVRTNDWTAFG